MTILELIASNKLFEILLWLLAVAFLTTTFSALKFLLTNLRKEKND